MNRLVRGPLAALVRGHGQASAGGGVRSGSEPEAERLRFARRMVSNCRQSIARGVPEIQGPRKRPKFQAFMAVAGAATGFATFRIRV